ncbi:MAG: helix-turn-helix domain-containing protein [Symbiobacteriaceae bacterium]|nr:helix-turn-helix domain-containing protein [Symbiobacteriaceae bacterium]
MQKKEIARRLQLLRIAAGLTQQKVAEEIGRKQTTVASWETGQSQPDINTLFRLCDLYGVSVNIFADSEEVFSQHPIISMYTRLPASCKQVIDLTLREMTRQNDRIISLEAALEEVSQVRESGQFFIYRVIGNILAEITTYPDTASTYGPLAADDGTISEAHTSSTYYTAAEKGAMEFFRADQIELPFRDGDVILVQQADSSDDMLPDDVVVVLSAGELSCMRVSETPIGEELVIQGRALGYLREVEENKV